MDHLLEICCYSFTAASIAAEAGADRIELCADAGEGGTTPGYGTLKQVRESIRIPVFPILRPRGGDFYYSDTELDIIKSEILLCRELGFEGVVTGALEADGQINLSLLGRLVELAYPMEVTFHRAFDRTAHPFDALETIIRAGCSRVLTSGRVPSAPEGAALLAQLVGQAGDRIVIMPGSGVRAHNIADIAQRTGAVEFHSSASTPRPTEMTYINEGMQEALTLRVPDAAEIRLMKAKLQER